MVRSGGSVTICSSVQRGEMAVKIAINIVIYQLCWVGCVIGAANMMPLIGVALAVVALSCHLFIAPRAGAELILVAMATLVGAVWDSLLVAAGWLIYPSGTLIQGAAPYWIVALWVSFATTFNVSLRWFKRHLLWAGLFGAIGGPLAFLAGERLGGVMFTNHVIGVAALALGWALLMPLMMVMANRWDGFAGTAPSQEVVMAENQG